MNYYLMNEKMKEEMNVQPSKVKLIVNSVSFVTIEFSLEHKNHRCFILLVHKTNLPLLVDVF